MLHSCFASSLSAEPATVLYLLTGAATLAIARFRSTKRAPEQSPTLMLICKAKSRETLETLNLL